MKLVQSSVRGAVEGDHAVRLLIERALLTRMVCRELSESDLKVADRRPRTALHVLLRWVAENQPQYVRIEPHASDGLEQMIVPDELAELVIEIKSGAAVCEALSMLLTADNSQQVEHDRAAIDRCLADYRKQHSSPIPVVRRFS